ncbi:hypothetical protein PENTCL1PPCAC_1690, partial [Pristionchus entomophagus]
PSSSTQALGSRGRNRDRDRTRGLSCRRRAGHRGDCGWGRYGFRARRTRRQRLEMEVELEWLLLKDGEDDVVVVALLRPEHLTLCECSVQPLFSNGFRFGRFADRNLLILKRFECILQSQLDGVLRWQPDLVWHLNGDDVALIIVEFVRYDGLRRDNDWRRIDRGQDREEKGNEDGESHL